MGPPGDRRESSTVPVQAEIEHLLRRTEFVARPARVAELMALPTLADAVNNVLDFTPNANPQLRADLVTHNNNDSFNQRLAAFHWWLDMMATRPRPLQEKMTLFWHGHFVSEWDVVGRTDQMMEQNQLFRNMAVGDFRSLIHGDVVPAGDADLPVERREREGFAEPELRPRTARAVHARHRQLPRGRRRRDGPCLDGSQLQRHHPPVRVPHEQPRLRRQDDLRHAPQLERPGGDRRDPRVQRGQAPDRRRSSSPRSCGSSSPTPTRRRTSSTTSPRCSSRTTSRCSSCSGRCSTAAEFYTTDGDAGSGAHARPSGSSRCSCRPASRRRRSRSGTTARAWASGSSIRRTSPGGRPTATG